jgi:hypothetical protein
MNNRGYPLSQTGLHIPQGVGGVFRMYIFWGCSWGYKDWVF